MAKLNLEKIFTEIEKAETPGEVYAAYIEIKDYVQKKLMAAQKEVEDEASDLQSKIDRISGN